MKKTIILSTCLILAAATICAGQTASSLEDLLCWFPDGLCSSIVHFDKIRYLDSCPEEIRRAYLDWSLKVLPFESNNLPLTFGARYNSVTSARIGRMSLKRCFKVNAEGEVIPISRKIAIGFTINGRPYGSWNWSHGLYVYRFDDLEGLVKEAIDRANLVALDVLIAGRPLYTFTLPGRRTNLYCYATTSNELLVAESTEHLQMMINTGLAGDIPVMQQLDLRDLKDEISIDTYLWKYMTDMSLYSATLEYVRLKDPQSPSIEAIEDHMEHMMLSTIHTMRWDISGNSSRRVYQFTSEEDARVYYREINQAGSLAARLHWQTEYFNGRALSFRPTLARIHEIREETGAEFKLELAEDRIVESCIDGTKTLLKLMEYAAGGDVRR